MLIIETERRSEYLYSRCYMCEPDSLEIQQARHFGEQINLNLSGARIRFAEVGHIAIIYVSITTRSNTLTCDV